MTKTCTVPGCERPAMEEDSFNGCRQHRAVFDAQAETEAWDLAWRILHPWVEAVEPIGSDELTRVMKNALREVDDNMNLAQDNLELAEAAANRQEKADTAPPTCHVGSATATPCTRPATVRVNSEDEPDMCAAHALQVKLQDTLSDLQAATGDALGRLEDEIEAVVDEARASRASA